MNARTRSRSSITRGLSSKSMVRSVRRRVRRCGLAPGLAVVGDDLSREQRAHHQRRDPDRGDDDAGVALLDDERGTGAIRTTPSAIRRKLCGAFTERLAPTITPGIEPMRMFPASAKSMLPPTQWAMPPPRAGRRRGTRRCPPLAGGELEERDQCDRDQRAAARGGEADHEPGGHAGDDRGDDVAAVEVKRRALGDHVAEEQGAQEGRDADDEQRAAQHPEHELVKVLAVALLEQLDHPDAGDRRGHRADRHPERDSAVHRLQPQMLEAADGLRDRRVEDVGPDRRHGADPEDEDQERVIRERRPCRSCRPAGRCRSRRRRLRDRTWSWGETSGVSAFVDRDTQERARNASERYAGRVIAFGGRRIRAAKSRTTAAAGLLLCVVSLYAAAHASGAAKLVEDINPTADRAQAGWRTSVDPGVAPTTATACTGKVWRSNGKPAGTRLLKDVPRLLQRLGPFAVHQGRPPLLLLRLCRGYPVRALQVERDGCRDEARRGDQRRRVHGFVARGPHERRQQAHVHRR